MAMEETQNTIIFPHESLPTMYIRLNTDNTVTVISKTIEMGQGIHTGHATMVADEIDAAPEQMRVEMAPSEAGFQAIYGNVLMGGMQGTGGNTGTQSSYMMYRMAGAGMRQMILNAAAAYLQADKANLSIKAGVVTDSASGKSVNFGTIATHAMAQPIPTDVKPKDPKDFTYMGKAKFPRVDTDDKIHGRETYPQDLKVPGMLVAMLARPKKLGGKVASFDAIETLKVPGVTNVVQIEDGVAVIGTGFWPCYSGREKLKVEFDYSNAVRMSSADINNTLTGLLDQPGTVALQTGDADAAIKGASKIVEATYSVPFQAHAPMETVSCIVQLTPGKVEMWGASQVFGFDSINIAQECQLPPDNIVVHQHSVGGSFGRWYGPYATPWIETIRIIKALGTDKPVKLFLSREDDLLATTCFYRPGYFHKFWAGLDDNGNIVGFKHRISGQSMLAGTLMAHGMVDENGVDFMSVESSINIAYQYPNYVVDLHSPVIPFRASPTRFGGTLHNGFSNEVFIDELATAAGVDPVEYRLRYLSDDKREKGCLKLAAEKSNWSTPLSDGPAGTKRGRGIAVTTSHRSYSACVAEVTVFPDNSYKIDKCVVALDCGQIINPDNLHSQMEGSIGFATSLGCYNEITFEDGESQQVYYSEYGLVRMHTMPKVESYFVESEQGPSGAGETIGSSVIPAIANALFNATGTRVRDLPLRLPNQPAEEGWEMPAKLNTFKGAKQSGMA